MKNYLFLLPGLPAHPHLPSLQTGTLYTTAERQSPPRTAVPTHSDLVGEALVLYRRLLLALTFSAVLLSGCGSDQHSITSPPPPSGPVAGVSFNGTVLIDTGYAAGSSVQLYEAGTSGNGSAATALLSAPVTTDAAGGFVIPSTFSCASMSTFLFLLAKGGSSTATAGPDTTWLMTPVGRCGDLSDNTFIVVDELTTVAAAYAFAPFLSTGGNLGASSTNTWGLANALTTAQTLVSTSTGEFPVTNPQSNFVTPVAKLNSLASMLTECAQGVDCTQLFSAAMSPGEPTPTNTLDAALSIARHPANNVSALYSYAQLAPGFQPGLKTAPPDWTVAITISGGGLNAPKSLAIDGSGNAWIASYYGVLSAFAPGGKLLFATGITGLGLNESHSIAIDLSNNIWVANDETPGVNNNGGTVTEVTHDGQPLSGTSGYTAGGIDYPTSLAADTDGSMWVANYASHSATLLTASGTAAPNVCSPTFCGFSASSIDFPETVVVDGNHFAWVANTSNGYVTRISPDGTQTLAVNCCYGAGALAIDANGYLWSGNHLGNSVSLVDGNGNILSAGFTGGGVNDPHGIAVDGAGNVWIANYQGQSISELSGSNSPTPGMSLSSGTGFGLDAQLANPAAIAIDASGSVWIANDAARSSVGGTSGSVTQFVGLAAPVATPLVGPVRLP